METYAHAFFTGALARYGCGRDRVATAAGVTGSVLPDLPSFAATGYFVGTRFLWDGWSAMHSEEMLDAIYFTGPFGRTGSILHSAVPAGLLLILYELPGLRRRDTRRVLLWLLLGWFGHAIADFLTHADDARPLFWPISEWTWASPVSYYNPLYYGSEFRLAEHGLMLLILLWLLKGRVAGGRHTSVPPNKANRGVWRGR